jgi:16S rRNA processing protein RimM
LKTVELGRVARAHGIRGEVKIDLHFRGSDLLLELESVLLARPGEEPLPRTIESARRADKFILVRFHGIADRNAADELRGALVLVPREALPEPGEGEYYLTDLIGARVVGPDGDVGRVVRVVTHPSVDSLIIETPEGSTVEQPLVSAWVLDVDPEQPLVTLRTLDGLIV